jgi:subtilisin family serine protease
LGKTGRRETEREQTQEDTMELFDDPLTELLVERHHAVITPDRPALVRDDQLLVSERDARTAQEKVARWVDAPQPVAAGVSRLPIRAGAGVNVVELLSDIRQKYRTLSVSPNHILRGAPSSWGGPAEPPMVLDKTLAAPEPRQQAREVNVAILDTGIWPYHQWFADRKWAHDVQPADFEVFDENPRDYQLDAQAGHGTFIAGIVVGEAPGARLEIRRVLQSDGVCDEVDLVAALHDLHEKSRATGTPVEVINLSLGSYTYDDRPSPVVADALARFGRSTVIVACAGNVGDDRPFWPAALKNVVAVGALDSDGSDRAPFSNFGWWVDACAIGERVESAFVEFDGPLPPTGDYDRDRFRGYATWSGTSFAAPKVAGAIARLAAERGIPASEAADRILDPAEQRSMPDLGVVVGVPGTSGA